MTEEDSTTISNNTNKTVENDSELDRTIQRVKRELKGLFMRRKDLILELGHAYEKEVSNPESICEEIKNALREEIVAKYVSARDIERCCPDQWKRKTRPKAKTKRAKEGGNDNLSFSPFSAKAVHKEAIGVSIGDAGATGIEPRCEPAQPVLAENDREDGNHCARCSQLKLEIGRLKEELLSIRKTKQEPEKMPIPNPIARIRRINIPKEKQRDVMNAMRSSRREWYLDLDAQGNIVAINSDNVGVRNATTGLR